MKHPLLIKLLSDTFDGLTDHRTLSQKRSMIDSYYFGRFIAAIQKPTVLNDILTSGTAAIPQRQQQLPHQLSKFIQKHHRKIEEITVVKRCDFEKLIDDINRLFATDQDDSALKQQLKTFQQNWPFIGSTVQTFLKCYQNHLPLPSTVQTTKADYTVQLDEKLLSDEPLADETLELFYERLAFRSGYLAETKAIDDDSICCNDEIDADYQYDYYRQYGHYAEDDDDKNDFEAEYGYDADDWFSEWLIVFLNAKISGDSTVLQQEFDGLSKQFNIEGKIS